MDQRIHRQCGFTLIELLTVVAILAVLGALAVVGYQKYTERARGVDIVEKYDALRTNAHAKLAQGQNDDCAKLAESLGTANLADEYATLSYGFEAVQGGYRPVLNVCAQVGNQGVQGVKATRGAHDTLAKNGVVEQNPVLTDSVVSFALRLTDGDAALCKTPPVQPSTTCGQAAQVAQAPSQPVQPAIPPQPVAAALPACPAGQQMMTHLVNGNWQRACQPTCARGQQLNPATQQCEVDHGGSPSTTSAAASALAQLPAAQRQQVQAAEQQLAQSMAAVTSVDDAIAQTMAAAQGLPSSALTQSIPGNSAIGRNIQVNCKLPEFPDGACKDQVTGNFCATTGTANSGNCNIAVMCPKTLGVCQGVTPEMRRIFDQSMQRIVGDWFAQHPGCTKFGQTGC